MSFVSEKKAEGKEEKINRSVSPATAGCCGALLSSGTHLLRLACKAARWARLLW